MKKKKECRSKKAETKEPASFVELPKESASTRNHPSENVYIVAAEFSHRRRERQTDRVRRVRVPATF